MEFFDNLEPLLRTYWFIALPVTIVFLIQSVMTFIGLDATDGVDADFDGDTSGGEAPFQLFSFRNLINFLIGFSWGGIAFYKTIENKTLLIIISVLIGSAFLYLFFLIIRQLMKLEEDNSFTLTKAVGKTGNVYLAIPAFKADYGIVQISVQGTVRELQAITEHERIESGALIRVVGIASDNLVIVERL